MKTLLRISIVLLCAATALAGQSQHIIPGEVPEGITAEEWGIVQEAYLKASNTDAEDFFGGSVAISGDTLVIGASSEDSNATGVNGDQTDNSATRAGAAYIFLRSGTTWSQQTYLKSSNTDAGDHFSSVSLSGNTLVVGAYGEGSNATGVNGDQSDNSAGGAGAAYVFSLGSGDYQATITDCSPVPAGMRIEWVPVSGWNSIVKCSTDLVYEPFTDLSSALPYPVNSFTDTVHGAKSQCFYQVDLEP